MFKVTKELYFCYGHRLLNYTGKCRNLHGHNGKAVITLKPRRWTSWGWSWTSPRSRRDRDVDRRVADHKMLLHRDDPVITELQRQGERSWVMDVNPTAENIAKLIFDAPRQRTTRHRGDALGDGNSFATLPAGR